MISWNFFSIIESRDDLLIVILHRKMESLKERIEPL